MAKRFIRFDFNSDVPIQEIRGTLRLAELATESLVGFDRVRLEARFIYDTAAHTVVIDTTDEVGRMLALIFAGYVRREFGDDVLTTPLTDESLAPSATGTDA